MNLIAVQGGLTEWTPSQEVHGHSHDTVTGHAVSAQTRVRGRQGQHTGKETGDTKKTETGCGIDLAPTVRLQLIPFTPALIPRPAAKPYTQKSKMLQRFNLSGIQGKRTGQPHKGLHLGKTLQPMGGTGGNTEHGSGVRTGVLEGSRAVPGE